MIRPVPPEPIDLGSRRGAPEVHYHPREHCCACNEAAQRVKTLEARVAELEERLQRITATPEMGRRTWNFEEGQ